MPAAAPIRPDKLLLYQKLVDANAHAELKGAPVLYTAFNGHMSSYLSKDGKLGLRLPPEDRDAFLKEYKAKLCEAYGVVQGGICRSARSAPGKDRSRRRRTPNVRLAFPAFYASAPSPPRRPAIPLAAAPISTIIDGSG